MRYTEAPARRGELLRRLAADGYVSSAQVATEFAVSEMTIRRDLRQLQSEGHARRVVGGAALAGTSPAPFEARERERGASKQAIAATCIELIADSSLVALDAGTTVAGLADLLPTGIAVVTHSVPLITACAAREDIELVGIGGLYQADTRSFAGPTARSAIEGLSVDTAVLSAAAVDETGIMSRNMLDAEIKLAMAAAALRVILLVDSSKFGGRAAIRVAAVSAIDTIITDAGVDTDLAERIRASGTDVIIAAGGVS